jgi:recombination protein RecT
MTTENTEIAPKTKPRTLKVLLSEDNVKNQFALALPKHLSADRFARVAITALTRTPKLQECTPESFMRCLLDLSAMGLEPDGRRAHLIPFGKDCTLVVDYKGKVELAMRCGNIASIHADKVCDADEFVVNRGKVERHTIDYKKQRGEAYAYYCLIQFKDGGEKCEIMTREEVEQIRNRSQGYKSAIQYNKSHPWLTDFDEMAKKTAFHRASKWIELSPEIREHFEKDYDLDVAQARNVTPTVRTEAINPFAPMLPAIEATTEEGGEA